MHKWIIWLLMGIVWLTSCQKLTPEGVTPRLLQIDALDQLRSIAFTHPDTGYVVGGQRWSRDLLLKTVDGGQTWEEQEPVEAFGKILFDLHMLDGQRGFAAGLDGKVLRTRNGGKTWRIGQVPGWQPMHAVGAFGPDTLIAVGGDGYSRGMIARSVDGGLNWAITDSLDRELRDIFVLDAQTAIVCGYGVIFRTEDAGRSWARTDAQGEFFSTLDFPASQVGYVAGRTGTILKTVDAGQSWTRLRNGNNPALPRRFFNAVRFVDAEKGYVVGDRGFLAQTDDGGESWVQIELETRADLHDLHIRPDGSGYLIGEDATLIFGQF
ncbi:MAG: YCF48-related protein [Bacteroidota bacterium]